MSNSRRVESNQPGLHENLEPVVRKHLATPFRKPYQQHTLAAFEQLVPLVERDGRPLIFDSCCGVGESTARIAQLHPDALVIGMDKSAHRLSRHPVQYQESQHSEYLLLQVDLNDLWRLAVEAGWQLQAHYLLYPNPWPKAKHLQRRWHGAAVFPSLLELGGELTMRSNWDIYLREFAAALAFAGVESQLTQYQSEEAMTPFERKYWASGQSSWQLTADLNTFTGANPS